MADVVLKDVTKIFDKEVYAVKEFNIEISDGDFVLFAPERLSEIMSKQEQRLKIV